MLKQFLIKLLVIGKLFHLTAVTAATNTFAEGEHFKRISSFKQETEQLQQSINKIENHNLPKIIVFFNYGCYGCWLMNKQFSIWSKTKVGKVNINYLPVSFNHFWEKLAKLYYVNKELGVYKDEEVFNQIHGEPHKALWLEAEMVDFYAQKNISKERLLSLLNSFDVARKVKNSEEIANIYNINITPDVIIKLKNDSYLVNLTMVKDLDQLFQVVEYLIQLDP